MDLIQFLCNEKLKDVKYAKDVYQLFISNTPFTSFVVHTPCVLFQFFPNAEEIMTTQMVYYYFFVVRSLMVAKFLNNSEQPELLKRSRQIKDTEIKTNLKTFFEISNHDLTMFTLYFKEYQENAQWAFKESGEIAVDLYIKANERFLLGLLLLLNPQVSQQPNYWSLVLGAELVAMVDEPNDTDTQEYKSKYKVGKFKLEELQKECAECNALIVKNKLSTQLWTRTVFKEEDLVNDFEKINLKNEMSHEMENVKEYKEGEEGFELL